MQTSEDLIKHILSEGAIGLSGLAAKIRSHRRRGHLTAQACWRWAVHGVKCPDGRTVKLECIRLAGRYLTSLAAFERFVAAQQIEEAAAPIPAPVRSAVKRQRASERAGERMEAVGM